MSTKNTPNQQFASEQIQNLLQTIKTQRVVIDGQVQALNAITRVLKQWTNRETSQELWFSDKKPFITSLN